ncbi:hypothetical protein C0992_010621 [Termitomyces sp. T32_za158]|nr:hypothetical protein C0992_010621 [Termitomyces sp. T32_za158]
MRRSSSLATLLALLVANANALNPRHVEIVHKRQAVAFGATGAAGVTLVQAPTGTSVPPLSSITFGMPSQATLPVSQTFSAGASGPVSGAPPLPTPIVFNLADWPAEDHIPPTDSDEVATWMKELDGKNIPNIPKTVDGSCVNDTAAAADAANRGWWTCGGYTRPTDIVSCPDKLTWGVSFDDGPSPYKIVAELGWTRHAIRTVLGVTPTTMRPPYGDIDDRVRAIALAMGLVPIMWTRTPDGAQFDTNGMLSEFWLAPNWKVAGGLVAGPASFATFQNILSNATVINTGFIVLQHDLYQITVDLAIGYTLNAALTHNPPFKLEAIGKCSNIPTSNLYFESNTNNTFPSYNNSQGGFDIDGDGDMDLKDASAGFTNTVSFFGVAIVAGVIAMFV